MIPAGARQFPAHGVVVTATLQARATPKQCPCAKEGEEGKEDTEDEHERPQVPTQPLVLRGKDGENLAGSAGGKVPGMQLQVVGVR